MKLPLKSVGAALFLAPLLCAQIMYVGTYTAPQSSSKGIYGYKFDAKTGKTSPLGLMAETPNPTFLAMHPNGKFLYAINETDTWNGKKTGSVTAYAVEKGTGKLTLLNQVSSAGPGPCHLSVDATGKTVVVANYSGGSFSSFPILADGKLGEAASFVQEIGSSIDKNRQSAPHGHSAYITKNNKFVLGGDLGTDRVMVFNLDAAAGKISPATPPSVAVKPGSGPRHLAIAPDQKHVYVLSEMGSIVTTFEFDAATAAMKQIDIVSTLPAGFNGKSTTAEIFTDAKGQYLYASNRGHDSIAVFSLDPKTAKPTLIQNASTGGKTPRAFVIDPSGNFIVAGDQDTNNFIVLKIDHATGKLTQVGDSVALGAPVTFAFAN